MRRLQLSNACHSICCSCCVIIARCTVSQDRPRPHSGSPYSGAGMAVQAGCIACELELGATGGRLGRVILVELSLICVAMSIAVLLFSFRTIVCIPTRFITAAHVQEYPHAWHAHARRARPCACPSRLRSEDRGFVAAGMQIHCRYYCLHRGCTQGKLIIMPTRGRTGNGLLSDCQVGCRMLVT